MKSIILAGGFAKRLWPLTKNIAKPLLEVGGRPLIEHALEKKESLDEIDEIIISTNKKFEADFRNWLDNYNNKKRIKLVIEDSKDEYEKLGVIGAINNIIKHEKIDDDLLVVGGDNIFEFDIKDIINMSKDKNSSVIALHDIKDKERAKGRFGVGVVDANSRIIDFKEKPEQPQSTLVSTCCYLFKKEDLSRIDEYLKYNDPDKPGYFIEWLHKRSNIHGYVFSSPWFDVGSFESLDNAKAINASESSASKSLLECRYDLRWASCLKEYEDYLLEHAPNIESEPIVKSEFETFVEQTDPTGYLQDIKCASHIARALINVKHDHGKKQAVVIGKDIRPGTDFIVRRFIKTIMQDPDMTVLYVGEGTTAYVAFCANHLSKEYDVAFSVQLSASHTLWYNIGVEPQYGLNDRFHLPGSAFDAADLEKIRQETMADNNGISYLNYEEKGEFKNLSDEMYNNYINTAVNLFDKIIGEHEDIKNSNLVMLIDTGNSIAKKYVVPLFDRLGLKYKVLNENYMYVPNREHDPNSRQVMSIMKGSIKGMHTDDSPIIGVAYDSDADRSPFFDEKGDLLQGDWIAALIAKQLDRSGYGYVFGFETNNHIGAPILIKGNDKLVIGTVDAGRHMDDAFANFSRVSIGKPFLFEKISHFLKDKECIHVIPHTDGPFVSALVYALVARILDKEKGIKESIMDAVPELKSYKLIRDSFDAHDFIKDKSKSFEQTKIVVLERTIEKHKLRGYESERFDKITGIIKNENYYILLRCSGHNNYEFRISIESKNDFGLDAEMSSIKQAIKESAGEI